MKSGTFGSVIFEERAAVKKQALIKNNELMPQAMKEMSILRWLDHPRIIKPITMKIDGDIFNMYLPILEPMENIKNKKDFMVKLLEGLVYLHDNKILHADIKTSNIMMDDEQNPYFIDFGSAKINDCIFENVTTYVFAAPEVIARKETCYKADVWSLGVVFLLIEKNEDWNYNIPKDFKGKDFYKYFVDQSNDPLIQHMLTIDREKRWSARECFKYMTGAECEKKIMSKNMIYPSNYEIDKKLIIYEWIMNVMNSEDMDLSFIRLFIPFYDHVVTKYKIEKRDLQLFSIVIFAITMSIYYPNFDIDIKKLIHYTVETYTRERFDETLRFILNDLDFDIIFEMVKSESLYMVSEDNKLVEEYIPKKYRQYIESEEIKFEEVGEGGHAVIKRVTIGNKVECRKYYPSYMEDELKSDIYFLKKLKSEWVVPLANTGHDWLSMPCYDMDLEEYVKKYLEPEDINNIIKQLIDGLKFIHGKGIIHSDIKPKNILVDVKKKRFYYTDFGLAVESGDDIKGCTYNYAPPEYFMEDDIRAEQEFDIFSLGLTCLYILIRKDFFEFVNGIPALFNIFNIFGVPYDIDTLPKYDLDIFPKWKALPLKKYIRHQYQVDLPQCVEDMLNLDPTKRKLRY